MSAEARFAPGDWYAVVGDRVPFEQLPQALEAMEDRQTFGRVVVER